ncbi:glycine--tRNA ligase [Candidatus Parcubacteria bacterium]|nr:glycine--tRNA ligase [Candidatus Parcubacteria bacterium]
MADKSEGQGQLMEKIISLCKRRGFVFPGSEIYGGLANSWDYGPLGVELKNNIKQLWWKRFVQQRDDMVGIDAALIMNPKVWEASGHVAEFTDPLVECKKCKRRFRADHIDPNYENTKVFDQKIKCPDCKGDFSEPRQFNLMMKTFLGPAEDKASVAYFRPETAQAMFVDFKNVLETSRKKLPFGIAQVGKAFRNEVTPGNFIFRTREFEQMEIEYFISVPKTDAEWEKIFEYWKEEMWNWAVGDLGLKKDNIHECECEPQNRAHYSKRTIDLEYEFPFSRSELYGLAYRTDFDLKNHFKDGAPYHDPESGEKSYPHVIEPTFGVDRSVLAVLCDAYKEEEERVVLKLKPTLAPYKAAVFPLLKNKPELVEKAKAIYNDLKNDMMVAWDDRGNIGKRYYSQDEIGTPYCITIDFDTLEKGEVTVRDRDTMKQEKVKVADLKDFLSKKLNA